MVVQHEFWAARWSQGLTGFNQAEANPRLVEHWSGLGLTPSARVLVPLCGKSVDMLWLRAQGHAVVGVEFVESAIHEFFTEHDLPYEPTAMGWRACDSGPPLTLMCQDFMTLQPQQAGRFDALYDRASVVALPPDSQARFGVMLGQLMAPGAPGLMLSFEYPPEQREGPPFATDERQLREVLGANFEFEVLARHDLGAEEVARFDVDWCAVSVNRVRRAIAKEG